ncbi:MAG TPA: 50S ribosomal protein L18 [Gammaproteobacteria bacterium]|nr:50S ribosomal protein L18 [Xanthomonadales bacterium]MCB1593565.1 50S ribosomal protein L18 [Xanthomonadales bacterium]HOP22364.1 50S ribosomal protein L18 [Gammaproteobacteria bacterium]HPI95541.1 50S ribosomal protein L18 [Gammaproteobacteria bacterium]HPQ86768.1 50S ribosomal protein L18 [Gammaproteobacteria bacterium]
MSSTKKQARVRRAKSTRAKIRSLEMPSLSIHRTDKNLYAQIISGDGTKTLASASSLEKGLVEGKSGKNIEAAKIIGKAIAERALKAGVEKVAFDRSGFLYHGKVKALAEAAREAGLGL